MRRGRMNVDCDPETTRDRLLEAFDLFESGVELMASNLRRKYPTAGPEQIERLLEEWLAASPGPRFGNANEATHERRRGHGEDTVTAIEQVLKDFLAACPRDVEIALVGGIAVSARTEPRFTRDLDFAVAVVGDDEASQRVFGLRGVGYEIAPSWENTTHDRLETVRLR